MFFLFTKDTRKSARIVLTLFVLPVLLIIFSTTDLPEVLAHGFATIGAVHLLLEVDLVLGHVAQVVLTRFDHTGYGLEAGTCLQLVRSERRGAVVGVRLADVQTGTVRIGGRSGAVSTRQIRSAGVTVLYFRLCQRTGYIPFFTFGFANEPDT